MVSLFQASCVLSTSCLWQAKLHALLLPELGPKPEQSVSHLEALALTSAFSILQVDKLSA